MTNDTFSSNASSTNASAPAVSGRDLSGTALGDYQLVRKIAEGGMGEVYEAIQLKLDRRVAVKILTEKLAGRTEFLQRFEREAKATAALNHPNLVQVYDFGQANGQFYLVMEFVAGEDLATHIKNHGKLPIAEALSVVEQTALALQAAAAKSIIHRDIKPANLLLTSDGRVKVSDLGLAKRLTEDVDVTTTGISLGSPHFLAPEQADDPRKADHRADIYSLGLTLLYLLTGKRPFDGNTAYALVLAHAQKPLPTGAELGTPLPDALEKFIHRMAAKDPDKRYQDYDSLLKDVTRVKAGFTPAANIGRARHEAQKVTKKRVLIACVTAVVVIGLRLALPTHPSPSESKPAPGNPTSTPDNTPPPPRFGRDPEDRPPFDGPPGRGGEPRRGMEFDHGMLLPIPPIRPQPNVLREGTLEQMLAEADAYATTNKLEYRQILDRYHQLSDRAAGTRLEALTEQKLNTAIAALNQAAQIAIESYRTKMQTLIKAKQPQEAYDCWRSFPPNLRSREVDYQIAQVLRENLPLGFDPKPTRSK